MAELDPIEIRRKKALFRAQRRGFKFAQILFGEKNAGGENGAEAIGFGAGVLLARPIYVNVVEVTACAVGKNRNAV